MKISIKLLGFCIVSVVAHADLSVIEFVHPGTHNTLEELSYIKTQVDNNVEPWASTFNKMVSGSYSKFSGAHKIDYTPTPHVDVGKDGRMRKDLSQDADACHIQSLLWYFTGNPTYAENVIKILDAWGSALEASDKALAAGPTLAQFCMGAELVKYTYANWDAADDAILYRFIDMAYDVLLEEIWPQSGNPRGNHWTLGTSGIIALAILNEDEDLFLKGMRQADELILKHITSEGINSEVCRDINPHSNMQNGGHTLTAQLLYVQGYDFFSAYGNRIPLASEYSAQIMNVGSPDGTAYTPNAPCSTLIQVAYTKGTGSHLSYFHGTNILGLDMPELKFLTETSWPEEGYRDGNGMGEFLYRSKGLVNSGGGKAMPDHGAVGPLAHWNFNNIVDGQQLIASTTGSAQMDLSDWTAADILNDDVGIRTNVLYNEEMGNALILSHQRNNGNHIDFHFSMTDQHYLCITYGVKGFKTGGTFTNYRWLISTDGQNFTKVAHNKTSTTNAKRRLHLSDYALVNDAPNVTLRLIIEGGTKDSNRIKFDNIHINTLRMSADLL